MRDVLTEAFMIMITGMGTVFMFLLVLLLAMHLLRYLTSPPVLKIAPTNQLKSSPTSAHIAAISIAIQRYRREQRQ